jgi:hypothetical protein
LLFEIIWTILYNIVILAKFGGFMIWDIIVLILYALSMVGVAFYTKNRSGSVDDFLLAGKTDLTDG